MEDIFIFNQFKAFCCLCKKEVEPDESPVTKKINNTFFLLHRTCVSAFDDTWQARMGDDNGKE